MTRPSQGVRPRREPLLVTAFIPVKSLDRGKSRLRGYLDPDLRIQLTYDSLRRVVHVLQSAPRIAQIVVITRDEQVAEWANWWKVSCLREQQHGLNAALREARERYAASPAILVLPSDLAAISVTDVTAIVDAAQANDAEPCVVIAPDRHGRGTNALLLKPPSAIEFEFGVNSAERHAQLAADKNILVAWYRSDSISLDLDSPDDLALYLDQW